MRKSLLFIFLVFLSTAINAATLKDTVLTFDKKFIECEHKWVALMNKDKILSYGFVYIDTQAGLTLDVAGTFKIENDVFIPNRRENSSVKVRIPVTNNPVAIIPNHRFKEMGITEVPEWLKSYTGESPSANRLYRIGFVYNEWSKSDLALPYLEKAKAIDPNIKGLKAEFAFAYNVLKEYGKAVAVLKDAINDTPNDCYLHKEMVYAQMNLGLADKARESAIKGIANCSDKSLKAEMAYNIVYQYFNLKDKKQFEDWANETAKWVNTDHQYIKLIGELRTRLDQKK
jgi:hypothetical protein